MLDLGTLDRYVLLNTVVNVLSTANKLFLQLLLLLRFLELSLHTVNCVFGLIFSRLHAVYVLILPIEVLVY